MRGKYRTARMERTVPRRRRDCGVSLDCRLPAGDDLRAPHRCSDRNGRSKSEKADACAAQSQAEADDHISKFYRCLLDESRDSAGTYVNRITFSVIRSLATRWSRGVGPAKNGLPRPATTGCR
jgi:hypothetical protein